MDEAIVPLPDGRSIPVDMGKGMGMNQNNVTVNVATDGSASTSSDGDRDSAQFGAAIAAAVQKEIQNQKRAGGMLNKHGAS